MTNRLHYADNLDALRAHVADESVDLVYLDPPFNSNANYNILFKSPAGLAADSQIEAFEDSWHWNNAAEDAFEQVMRSGHPRAFDLLRAMRSFLGENDMMAYLSMMAIRLIELHRVLKPTGSLYLHCDPTASHYLKLLLDGVFDKANFRNEIIWCYRKWSVAQGQFVRNHDVILFYSRKEGSQIFHTLYGEPSPGTMKRWGGKRQRAVFENGVRKAASTEDAARSPLADWWDISILNPNSKERLGYPTQKPLALLERIIAASSNPGDLVLDPFCGCGTAIHAAEKLGRRWIGIDITHLAISLIERRMKDAFPGVQFTVEGTPKDLASALDLAERDKYQFQWWAVAMIDGVPLDGKKKGADGGIDGVIYFKPDGKRSEKALISVKGGHHVGVQMIRDLHSAMEREKAPIGVFVTAALPTGPMLREAAAVGRFTDEWGRGWPRLQIITLAELFRGVRPAIPFADPLVALRRARREETSRQDAFF
ncbi:DNA methyltransferase [Allosphingosinicella humi]